MDVAALDDKIIATKEQLAVIRSQRSRASNDHQRQVVLRFKQDAETCRKRMEKYGLGQSGDISIYRRALASDGISVVSPYILSRQAKLCHMVHRMETENHMLGIANYQNSELVKYVEQSIKKLETESAEIEVELLNRVTRTKVLLQTLLSEQIRVQEEQRQALASLRATLDAYGGLATPDEHDSDEEDFLVQDMVHSFSGSGWMGNQEDNKSSKNNFVQFVDLDDVSTSSPVSVRSLFPRPRLIGRSQAS